MSMETEFEQISVKYVKYFMGFNIFQVIFVIISDINIKHTDKNEI